MHFCRSQLILDDSQSVPHSSSDFKECRYLLHKMLASLFSEEVPFFASKVNFSGRSTILSSRKLDFVISKLHSPLPSPVFSYSYYLLHLRNHPHHYQYLMVTMSSLSSPRCNSGKESQKIAPKVGNEQSLQGLLTGC